MSRTGATDWVGILGLDQAQSVPRGTQDKNGYPVSSASDGTVTDWVGLLGLAPPDDAAATRDWMAGHEARLAADPVAQERASRRSAGIAGDVGRTMAQPVGEPVPPRWEAGEQQPDTAGFFGQMIRGAKRSVAEGLPPGAQEFFGYDPTIPVRMQGPEPTGAGGFIGEVAGGLVPSLKHPETLVPGVGAMGRGVAAFGRGVTGAAAKEVAEAAAGRVGGWLAETGQAGAVKEALERAVQWAGPAGPALRNAIEGGAIAAPMGAIQEAQANPEQWVTDPFGKLLRVVQAGGVAMAAGVAGGAATAAPQVLGRPSRSAPPAPDPLPEGRVVHEPVLPAAEGDSVPPPVAPEAPLAGADSLGADIGSGDVRAPAEVNRQVPPVGDVDVAVPAAEPVAGGEVVRQGEAPITPEQWYERAYADAEPIRKEAEIRRAFDAATRRLDELPPDKKLNRSEVDAVLEGTGYRSGEQGFPTPDEMRSYLVQMREDAIGKFRNPPPPVPAPTPEAPAPESPPTPDFASMKTAELRAEAKARGLPTSGTKAKLIERLGAVDKVPKTVVQDKVQAAVEDRGVSDQSAPPSPESTSSPSAKPRAEDPKPPGTRGIPTEPPKPPPPEPPAPKPEPSPETTSARVADITRDRKALLGLDAMNSPERRTWKTALDTARTQGLDRPDKAMRLAGEVAAKPRALSDVETAGLVQHAATLKLEHADIVKRVRDMDDRAELVSNAAEALRIEQEFDTLTTAIRKSGTEKGRALASQKLTLDSDLDLVSVLSRAKVAKGKNLTAKERAAFEKLTKELEAANERVKSLEIQVREQTASRALRKHRATKRKSEPEERAALLNEVRELLKAGCVKS